MYNADKSRFGSAMMRFCEIAETAAMIIVLALQVVIVMIVLAVATAAFKSNGFAAGLFVMTSGGVVICGTLRLAAMICSKATRQKK